MIVSPQEYINGSQKLLTSRNLISCGLLLFTPAEFVKYSWKSHLLNKVLQTHPCQIQRLITALVFNLETDSEDILCALGASDEKSLGRQFLSFVLNSSFEVAVGRFCFIPSKSKDVSTDAKLSFQFCLVPFLCILSSSQIAASALLTQTSIVTTMVYKYLKSLMHSYFVCIDALLQARSIIDPTIDSQTILKSQCAHPITFSQVLLPMIRVVYQTVTHFKSSIYEPFMIDGIYKLSCHVQSYVILQASHSLDQPNIDSFAADVATREMNRLLAISQTAQDQLVPNPVKPSNSELNRAGHLSPNHPWYFAKFTPLVPPGSQVTHDNDFMDISQISILPSMGELLATTSPTLPGNYMEIDESHWLPKGAQRLIDCHFRLLREDLIGPIRSNIAAYLEYLANPTSFVNVNTKKSRFRASWKKESIHQTDSSGQVDLFYYTNVTFSVLQASARVGMCIQVLFETNENLVKGDRLMFGGMITLLIQRPNQSYHVVFGTVSDRKDADLSSKPKCSVMVKIPLAFLTGEVLQLMMNHNEGISPHILVETNQVMFEAYRPILESLKMVFF